MKRSLSAGRDLSSLHRGFNVDSIRALLGLQQPLVVIVVDDVVKVHMKTVSRGLPSTRPSNNLLPLLLDLSNDLFAIQRSNGTALDNLHLANASTGSLDVLPEDNVKRKSRKMKE